MRAEPNRRTTDRAEAGFSLVELMVVVAIMGLLAGVVAYNLRAQKGQASAQKARADLKVLDGAITLFHTNVGRYPGGLEDLIQSSEEGWQGPYIQGGMKALMDPWKRPYVYQLGGGSQDQPFLLASYGGDGVPGGDGENKDIYFGDTGGH